MEEKERVKSIGAEGGYEAGEGLKGMKSTWTKGIIVIMSYVPLYALYHVR
jgi:hypothetical protein